MPQGNIHIYYQADASKPINTLFLKAEAIDGIIITIHEKPTNVMGIGAYFGTISIKPVHQNWIDIPVCSFNDGACRDVIYYACDKEQSQKYFATLRTMTPTYEEWEQKYGNKR